MKSFFKRRGWEILLLGMGIGFSILGLTLMYWSANDTKDDRERMALAFPMIFFAILGLVFITAWIDVRLFMRLNREYKRLRLDDSCYLEDLERREQEFARFLMDYAPEEWNL